MPTETKEPTLLERLTTKRQVAFDSWAKFIEDREKVEADFESRSETETPPSEAEATAHVEARVSYRARADQLQADVENWDQRIADQEQILRDKAKAEEAAAEAERSSSAVITYEPRTYERYKAQGDDGVSYYRDLAAALVKGVTFRNTDAASSMTRLQQHSKELDRDMPKRVAERDRRARKQLEEVERRSQLTRRGSYLPFDAFRSGAVANPFMEQRVEPNSTQGQGGYFIPPLWLEDDFIPGLRAHLIAAGLCRQFDLPSGTNSINIPKLANLTTVGYQQLNNAGLPSTDWSDTAVTANVKTMGGYSDVALQLLEQSPHEIVDEVVTADLMAARNKFIDQQVLAGDGLNTNQLNGGHLMGLYPSTNWANTNSVTYTNGSPVPYQFPLVLGAMASQISKTRFDAENYKTVLYGSRWFWFSTGPDGNDRPLGETMGGGRFNIAAAVESGLQAEGLVGTLPFLSDTPVYIDDNVPTNAGTGANQDVAISALWDDVWLFQGPVRTNVYNEILSASLGVRFQLYNYAAMLVRYGQSLAIATGTGFTPASGPSGLGITY